MMVTIGSKWIKYRFVEIPTLLKRFTGATIATTLIISVLRLERAAGCGTDPQKSG